MDQLAWEGPFVLREYINALLDEPNGPWPRSGPGVYVVTMQRWTTRPTTNDQVLYAGGSGNLLERIGNLVADGLGFWGEREGGEGWVGRHSGAQSLWTYCEREKKKVGDLVLGWAPTTSPCHWCIERELVRVLSPELNRRSDSGKCCCG